jgi:hypothetical protein
MRSRNSDMETLSFETAGTTFPAAEKDTLIAARPK